jgi:transposase InsO family protein
MWCNLFDIISLINRRPPQGLIHHSDRGVQYASAAYRDLLKTQGVIASMSRKGCCYDNAQIKAFFSTLKVESVYRTRFETRRGAQGAIFGYIEAFYNRRRRHIALGYLSPVEFENLVN